MSKYGKLKLFKFVNLQSWEDKTIELSDGLTAIEAQSETGKSVYIKCFRLGCNYEEYTPLKRKSIIRDWDKPNSGPGIFTVMTDKKYVVQFTFNPTNVTTLIIRPDGTKQLIKGPANQEALDILGLVKHQGSSRIVNILDNEEPMLFDGTDNNYNNNVLSGFINHRKMSEMYKTAEENLKYYDSQLSRCRMSADKSRTKLTLLPKYGNLNYVKDNLSLLYALDLDIEYGERILTNLNNIKDTTVLPEINTDVFDLLHQHIKINTNILERIPVEITELPTTSLDQPLQFLLNNIISTNKMLGIVENILDLKEQPVVETHSLEILSNIAQYKTRILNLLDENLKIKLHKTLEKQQTSDINLLARSIKAKRKLIEALVQHEKILQELNKSKQESERILNMEKEIKEALEYCPLCGNKMTEECEHIETKS